MGILLSVKASLFSSHTASYFRAFIIFCLLLTGFFYAKSHNLIPQLSSVTNGDTVIFLPLILLAGVTLLFFVLSLVSDLAKDTEPENAFMYFVSFFLILIFLPLYAAFRLFIKPLSKLSESGETIKSRLFSIILVSLSVAFLLFSFTFFASDWGSSIDSSRTVIGQRLGVMAEPIPIAGTGSMYPTFPKGESEDPLEQSKELVATAGMLPYPGGFSIFGNRFFGEYKLKRGDIVSFSNDKTKETTIQKYGEEAGLIKRIIGMPGDKVEMRDGILYINEDPQKEGYIAKPRSTFGGEFLPDCRTTTVPHNKLFVLGDNRTASNDSRFDIGFVDFADVDHVLPYEKQIGVVDKLWRDPKNDLSDQAKISIDRVKILSLINEQRKKNGTGALKFDNRLVMSAQKRGEKMIQYDDFSTEAKKSGYGLQQSIGESGYSNVIYGEFYVQGYYEAEQLIENLQEFPKTVEFLNRKDYTDMGFAEVTGLLNGCPTHVIVFHFGGYVPPDYKPADIEGWRKSLENLRKIQPSWEDLKNSGEFYTENKTEIDQLTNLISSGISSLDSIVERMESNQWLTDQQKQFADNQGKLYDEIDRLTKLLNERSKEFSSRR